MFTVGRESKVKNTGMREDNLLSLSYGRIIQKDINTSEGLLPESFETYQIVQPGDVVFRFTDLQNDQRSLRSGRVVERGIITSAYMAFTPRGVNARYFEYLMRAYDVTKVFYSFGGSIRQSLKYDDVRRLPILTPPLPEQHAIADFLDRETAKIDVLIEKQNQLVERLRERRDAQWSALYLGTDGAELPVRRLIDSIVDGPFGSSLTSAHYSDEGTRVIRLGNIGINEFRDHDQAFIPVEYGRELAAHTARPGDVVMAGLGDERMPLGRAAVVPAGIGPAIVKADCYRLQPNTKVRAAYLAWALSAPPVRPKILDLSRGATRSRLNTCLARQVRLRVPDITEQDRLLTEWSGLQRNYDALIEKAERFVELARERRSALVTAAITGQLDVVNTPERQAS